LHGLSTLRRGVKEEMRYTKIILESIKLFKKNPYLLVPNFMLLGVTILLSLLFLYFNGSLFASLNNPSVLFEGQNNLVDILNSLNVHNNFLKLILTFIGFILANFFIGAGLSTARYGMIKDLVNGEKTSLKKGFKFSAKNCLKVVELKVVVYLLMALLAFIFNFIFSRFVSYSDNFLFFVLLFSGLAYLIVNLVLLFRFPVMFLNDKRALPTLKKSFLYFKNKKRVVFLVWLIVLLATLLFEIILLPVNRYLFLFFNPVLGIILATLMFYLIRNLVLFVVQTWSDIYLFLLYAKEK